MNSSSKSGEEEEEEERGNALLVETMEMKRLEQQQPGREETDGRLEQVATAADESLSPSSPLLGSPDDNDGSERASSRSKRKSWTSVQARRAVDSEKLRSSAARSSMHERRRDEDETIDSSLPATYQPWEQHQQQQQRRYRSHGLLSSIHKVRVPSHPLLLLFLLCIYMELC